MQEEGHYEEARQIINPEINYRCCLCDWICHLFTTSPCVVFWLYLYIYVGFLALLSYESIFGFDYNRMTIQWILLSLIAGFLVEEVLEVSVRSIFS